MNEPILETLQLGDIRMRVAIQGTGPLVLFCHGWPESWYSWRHQMAAVAAAGYRAVAPDMRGYGGTDAPQDARQYTLAASGGRHGRPAQGAGRDAGGGGRPRLGRAGGLACGAAAARPVSRRGRHERALCAAVEGRPDQPRWTSRACRTSTCSISRPRAWPRRSSSAMWQRPSGASISAARATRRARPASACWRRERAFWATRSTPRCCRPGWMRTTWRTTPAEFCRAGFRGGLNWYRCLRLNSELLAPWHGAAIRPAVDVHRRRAMACCGFRPRMRRSTASPPPCRGCGAATSSTGAGHWVQRERATRVSSLLLGFLDSL
jgi:pimeloyl-ACP methyl ester carboxylesterase